MAQSEIDNAFNERFPGNQAAFNELQTLLQTKRVVGFVGAGASAEVAPTWIPFLLGLIGQAQEGGLLTKEDAAGLISQVESDPLETANSLEEIYGRPTFRSKIGSSFLIDDQFGTVHKLAVDLGLKGVVTTNYDEGLTNAYADQSGKAPIIIGPTDNQSLIRWERQDFPADGRMPVIHWHGIANNPSEMVFTADDYSRFYADSNRYHFLERLWKNEQLLCIGYGFKDPFLNRVAEGALRLLDSDSRHYALIGIHDSDIVSPLTRKNFIKKYRLIPIFYPVITDQTTKKQNHNALIEILRLLVSSDNKARRVVDDLADSLADNEVAETDENDQHLHRAMKDFKSNLFATPRGTSLYVDPTMTLISDDESIDDDVTLVPLNVLATAADSYIIVAPPEFGATTLAKKLVSDTIKNGEIAVYRAAPSLPNFQKKLLQEVGFVRKSGDPRRTLVIDDFDFQVHERLIKEIAGLNSFDRIVLITRRADYSLHGLVKGAFHSFDFIAVKLESLSRADIRILATQLYETNDELLVSHAVEKAYGDLLDLCIPLTPSNVIMYLSIIYKEGDFLPLSRLQIIDRYIHELLKRPNDIYQDSFSARNKIDVVSSFVSFLHTTGKTSFVDNDWHSFCQSYMHDAITAFDATGLLHSLVTSRILVRGPSSYIFKYRLFYSYFLGRYVANRPAVLARFLEQDDYLSIYGLVEIISGISVDNSALVIDVVEKLESSLSVFESQYNFESVKIFDEINWVPSKDEEERLWKPIAAQIESGPKESREIDVLKTSLIAEKRTEEQSVVIRNFDTYERQIIDYQSALIAALNNSDTLDGDTKLRAVKAIYSAYQNMMQSGVVLAPAIAQQKILVWKGVAFINEVERGDTDAVTYAAKIAFAIPRAVYTIATELMGAKKLGEIYRRLEDDVDLTPFGQLLNYTLLVKSKPNNWRAVASQRIESTNRFSMYLRFALDATRSQFDREINTHNDQAGLKHLIATIRAKRFFNKERPAPKEVSKMLLSVDKKLLVTGKA